MTTWTELHRKFLALHTEFNKSSSGSLQIQFIADGDIIVEYGAYDILDYPRHYTRGPFKSEVDAMIDTENTLIEMERKIKDDL